MRKILSIMLIMLVTFGIIIESAEAKRFGGGRSFGMQRTVTKTPSPSQTASPAAKKTSSASKWFGPLAGLAMGGLLASLFMGNGLGAGILSWLAIAGVGLLLWNLFRRKSPRPMLQPMTQPMHEEKIISDVTHQFTPTTNSINSSEASVANYPLGFDADSFLRYAKVQFIRLQAAYDANNIADLREFTTPDVLGEIQVQIQERGDEVNYTDVVKLDANVLEASHDIVAVEFSGLIKEGLNLLPEAFTETWHFKRDDHAKTNWLVAGVQQTTH